MSEEWTNITIDSQILSSFMGCPREMDFRFNKHLVPLVAAGAHFAKGSLSHKGLEVFYALMKDGIDWSTRRAQALAAMRQMAPTLDLDAEHVLEVYRNFEEYADYRKNDVFHVAFTEHLFKIKAYEDPFPFRLRIYLTGRIDLGIIEGNQLIPIDHKSESEAWFYSELSNQFKIYAIACKSQRLVVNRFGFQKSKKPEVRFKRDDINFEKDVLEEFQFEVLPYYVKQMLICDADNYYPPNYSHCIKGHFGCVFSDKYNKGICNVDRAIRNQKLKMYFIEKEWNINAD